MSSLSLKPASELTIPQLAELMTRSFESYFVPVNITDVILLTMLRRDGVDFTSSRVILAALGHNHGQSYAAFTCLPPQGCLLPHSQPRCHRRVHYVRVGKSPFPWSRPERSNDARALCAIPKPGLARLSYFFPKRWVSSLDRPACRVKLFRNGGCCASLVIKSFQ